MITRSPILVAAAVACAALVARPRAANALLLDARVGLAAPAQGNLEDDLGLDVGLGAGASLGFELAEFLAIDLRYDALLLYGSAADGVDSTWMSHAVTLGPELELRWDAFELYVGAHPGVYFTQLGLDAELRREIDVDTDWSIDFGLNAELGARWFLSDRFFLGAEAAYHLVLVNDDHWGFDVEGAEFEGGPIDESVGALTFGMTVGYRF
ncbi:MAG: outer membrane beta-barrel protein [bacterium]